jgi:hypothetical protein
LTFDNSAPLLPDYVFTTEVRVKSNLPFAPWPFEVVLPDASPAFAPSGLEPPVALAPLAASDAAHDAVLSALAMGGDDGEAAMPVAAEFLDLALDDPATTTAAAPGTLIVPDLPAVADSEDDVDPLDDLVDASLAGLLD